MRNASETQGAGNQPPLVRKVTFGLGAALLAGAVLAAIPAADAAGAAGGEHAYATVGLGAAINQPSGNYLTTCCGQY
jgi:hypothetical protein